MTKKPISSKQTKKEINKEKLSKALRKNLLRRKPEVKKSDIK
jgi:hypothetical protein